MSKQLIVNYTFSAAAKTVTFNDYTDLRLEQVLLITNVTDNVIIYNFGSATAGGSLTGNVLTLDYNTTTMDDADNLQIFMDVDDEIALSEKSILSDISTFAAAIATARGVASDLRVTVLGGGVTISSGTVTTVTTVGNQTSMGGYLANNQIPSLMNQAAFQNINNVTRV